jgi:hypothetical protein
MSLLDWKALMAGESCSATAATTINDAEISTGLAYVRPRFRERAALAV